MALNTKPIITSILDTDAYKLHMQQAVLHLYPNYTAVLEFHCRNGWEHLGWAAEAVREQVEYMQLLALTDEEYSYLASKRYFKKDYLDWLKSYRFNPKQVTVCTIPAADGEADLSILIEGPWVETILWEVPLLAVVSEVVHRVRTPEVGAAEAEEHMKATLDAFFKKNSADELRSFFVTDFGTRRRYSAEVQEIVLKTLHSHPMFSSCLLGTSNYMLAMKLQLAPVGTQAHEWFQAHQQIATNLRDFQRLALKQWLVEYPQDLLIALTDCITMDSFIADFDADLANAYGGVRHDSGDPFVWARKVIAHYRALNIDPRTKTLIFSDSLTLEKAAELHRTFSSEAKLAFGIGTNLTCSIPGVTPLNIVIKMKMFNGNPVAKISDAPGKSTHNATDFVRRLCETFGVAIPSNSLSPVQGAIPTGTLNNETQCA
ncbi:putative Nicotinate phosphoribosyltransferase (NAPRTase) family [Trypanosoma vivax]|uniref:nicotinate phosphoribosyltransferase n=1 Tax=Trypanosoma vivax (strain Y486) TaxID=1055687 RepID=G0U872_TRYVY|nr:putative nicotinate phosphoribosyltransferase [Trypanosoma vivax]KAH8607288.1 putative Nicotinate phosphoribosyltransferase (NAPRTase) family [Trypanosoma vivax]CCC52082.1 putative nicotinate phosphoribosyltransferase [Trypanosoma vivax Y486]